MSFLAWLCSWLDDQPNKNTTVTIAVDTTGSEHKISCEVPATNGKVKTLPLKKESKVREEFVETVITRLQKARSLNHRLDVLHERLDSKIKKKNGGK